ncbi:Holliday junction resolvase RuvX [Candidatus Uhrbacteria bacterium]|nr:Holliday junction resolvase RuvX [Candidatus Uhrbacteria bacterium]
MRILGIDYGAARVGVALGDTETRIASPWCVIANEDADEMIDRLMDIAKKEQVKQFVIGIPHPLHDQTRETDQAREIRAFAKRLGEKGIPVIEEDETLSSALAQTQAQEMNEYHKRDDLAAAAILQTYLDRV